MKLTFDYPPLWLAGFAAAAWVLGRIAPMPVPRWLGWTLVALAASGLILGAGLWALGII